MGGGCPTTPCEVGQFCNFDWPMDHDDESGFCDACPNLQTFEACNLTETRGVHECEDKCKSE